MASVAGSLIDKLDKCSPKHESALPNSPSLKDILDLPKSDAEAGGIYRLTVNITTDDPQMNDLHSAEIVCSGSTHGVKDYGGSPLYYSIFPFVKQYSNKPVSVDMESCNTSDEVINYLQKKWKIKTPDRKSVV